MSAPARHGAQRPLAAPLGRSAGRLDRLDLLGTAVRWADPVAADDGAGDPSATGGPVRVRTAAGAAATRRRQRRIARRRPAPGVLPSRVARRVVVTCTPEPVRAVVRGYVMGRAARLAMTLTVAVSAVLIGLTLASAPAAGGVTQVTVAPGDSLWSIAVASDPGRDPREVVEDIRRLNALTDGVLPVGVMLTVPAAQG